MDIKDSSGAPKPLHPPAPLAWLYEALVRGRRLEVFARPEEHPDQALIDAGALRKALPARWSAKIRFSNSAEGAATPISGRRLLLAAEPSDRLISSDEVIRIDSSGTPLSDDFPAPAPDLIDYADAVQDLLAQHVLPDGFGRLTDRLLSADGRPSAPVIALLPAIRKLALCLEADQIAAPGVLQRCLRPLAHSQPLPWADLILPTEWAALHHAELTAFLLTASERLDDDERRLRDAAVAALRTTHWQLLDPSNTWQRPTDPRWWARLFELFVAAPRLLPVSLLAGVGCGISLDDVPDRALASLLSAELAKDALWRRRFQADALAGTLMAPGVAPILAAACDADVLDLRSIFARLANTRDLGTLAATLTAMLTELPEQTAWRALAAEFAERLATTETTLRESEARPLAMTIEARLAAIDLPRDGRLLLALLGLRAAIGLAEGADLPEPLWRQLARLGDAELQSRLLERFLDSARGTSAGELLTADGSLRLPWLKAHADRILAEPSLRERLQPTALVALAQACRTPEARRSALATLDPWLRADADRALSALIDTDVWCDWRSATQASAAAVTNYARRWLTHPAHTETRARATLPTWHRVMADLDGPETGVSKRLNAEDIVALFAAQNRFPWISGHSQQQAEDIAARCQSLGALAELSEQLRRAPPPDPEYVESDLDRRLITQWTTADLTPGVLAWLREPDAAHTPLSLTESALVLRDAGERFPAALRAHAHAIAATLPQDPDAALQAADALSLWHRPELRTAVTAQLLLLPAHPPLPAWIECLEQRVPAMPASAKGGLADSPTLSLAGDLHEQGCTRLAAWLAQPDPNH